MNWLTYAVVAIGSALGGVTRFWLSGVIAERYGNWFPFGTLLVNLSGSFLIGFIAAVSTADSRFLVNANVRTFLMVGICGGYTTFSSFSLQTLNLAQEGQWFYAALNVVASVALCLIGVWLGLAAGQWLSR